MFIEKIANISLSDNESICIKYIIDSTGSKNIEATIQKIRIEEQAAREIANKLKTSKLLFLHNSTMSSDDNYFVSRGRLRSFYQVMLSDEEQKSLYSARKTVAQKVQQLAKHHKSDLSSLLGRLSEKYDVEFSSIESFSSKHVPFIINLKDKKVQIPLTEWGSGTQNRTQILMSILQAKSIKEQGDPKDKITPIVIVEEPESFLHPSAQSEFGKLLRILSAELGIQIIVTTHNPHMLNHEQPAANILLARKHESQKTTSTFQVDTTGEKWMAPFAEHLGMSAKEFEPWGAAFTAKKAKVLLVEGDLDVEYFNHIRDHKLTAPNLQSDIDIVPYGGKGVFKNTLLVKFVLNSFDSVYVTFDKDAEVDSVRCLERLGLNHLKDFCPIGVSRPGKDCIEGIVPQRIIENVMTGDLALALSSAVADERKTAKDNLKKLVLEEFKKHIDYTEEEMAEFCKIIKKVNKKLNC